jgi:hypothetical protein
VVQADSWAVEWRVVKTWAGTGMKETESFEVASREWRINWSMTDPTFKGAGILQICVHNENDQLVSLAANTNNPGSDTSYVRGKGRFYLKISSANCKWKVTVEDQR